jgi:hypothetical protein
MRSRTDQEGLGLRPSQSKPILEMEQNTLMQESNIDSSKNRMAELKKKMEFFKKGKQEEETITG